MMSPLPQTMTSDESRRLDASELLKRVPVVNPLQVEFNRLLVHREMPMPGSNAGKLVFQHWDGARPSGLTGLCFASPVGQLWIGLANWHKLHPALAVDRHEIPERVRTGLLEAVSQPLLNVVAELTGWPLADPLIVIDDQALQERFGLSVGFEWLSGDGHHVSPGVLRFESSVFERLKFALPPARPTELKTTLPVTLVVELGHAELSLDQLKLIESGDAVRVSPAISSDGVKAVRISLGQLEPTVMLARVEQSKLILEKIMSVSLDQTNGGEAVGEMVALGEVPNTVTFELGRLRTTVGEVSDMKIGQSISVPGGLDFSNIALTVQGHCFARGQLVAIGDELAVQITEVAENSQRGPGSSG